MSRVRGILREEGPQALWWRGLAAVVYRRLTVLAKDAAPAPAPEAPRSLQVVRIGPGDVDEYRRLRPDTPEEEVRRRLAGGQVCVIGRLDGEPVACRWYSLRRAEIPYLGLSFELPEDRAYLHDAFTAPHARGRRVRLHGHAEVLLRRCGIRRYLATVLPENGFGMRFAVGAGFECVGRIVIVRLPGRRFVWRSRDLNELGAAHPLAVPWSLAPPGLGSQAVGMPARARSAPRDLE